MRENWGQPGMPPRYYEVLDRQILRQSSDFTSEVVYLKGSHPHLGKPHEGWTGKETIVQREIYRGEVRIKK